MYVPPQVAEVTSREDSCVDLYDGIDTHWNNNDLPMEYLALKPLWVTLVSVRNLSSKKEPVESWVDGRVLPQSLEMSSAFKLEPSCSSR